MNELFEDDNIRTDWNYKNNYKNEYLNIEKNNEFNIERSLKLPNKNDYRIICFDTETSGFTKQDVIISIAGVEIINGQLTGNTFDCFGDPTGYVKYIHPAAIQCHGIKMPFLQKKYPKKLNFNHTYL